VIVTFSVREVHVGERVPVQHEAVSLDERGAVREAPDDVGVAGVDELDRQAEVVREVGLDLVRLVAHRGDELLHAVGLRVIDDVPEQGLAVDRHERLGQIRGERTKALAFAAA